MRLVLYTSCLAAISCGGRKKQEQAHPPDTTIVSQASDANVRAAMSKSESIARGAWFHFELTEVGTLFAGDWAAFHAHKLSEESRFEKEFHQQKDSFRFGPKSAQEARATRVLNREFEQVALPRRAQALAAAKEVLQAIKVGDIRSVAERCYYYTGVDRVALCEKHLKKNASFLAHAAALAKAEGAKFGGNFDTDKPSPSTGMVGQIRFSFGPTERAPEGKEGYYPNRHQIELWWSGQVQPEPNTPPRSSPSDSESGQPGHWRFYAIIKPYTYNNVGRE